ncbi:zinc-ribbon domain-containing protein [Anaerocolumna jejuensis]|uniref:zinc-ribbon domain-containing protein n=1 Tax=Anaerocolumna jejuensis TaxID=259063 RepID=UPI003F7BF23C
MALINCPECNKEISDKAVSCPHCGYIVEKQPKVKIKKTGKIKKLVVFIFLFFIIVIGFISIFFVFNLNSRPDIIKVKNFKFISYNDNQEKVEKIFGTGIDTSVSLFDGYDYDGKLKIVYDDQTQIRYIEIDNKSIVTYKNIKVGDDVSKIKNTFKYEIETGDGYSVLFDDKKELASNTGNQKDSLIWIDYSLDDSNKIEKIIIYDYKFGKTMS